MAKGRLPDGIYIKWGRFQAVIIGRLLTLAIAAAGAIVERVFHLF
jgi:hypothetical protein